MKPLATIPQPYNIINTESNIKPDDFNAMADFVVDTDLSIIHEYKFNGKCDPTEGFYVDQVGEEKKPAYHPFHAIINRLKLDNKPDHFDNNHICDYVISLFLFYVSKIVNAKLYRLLGIFFRHLREALNEYGYQEVETFYKEGHSDEARMHIPQKKIGRDFTQEEDVHYLPLIANRFISDYLPERCPDFDQELALSLMFDFCGWLFRKKLTKIKLAFSQGV